MRGAVTPAVLVMMTAMALEGCATRQWVSDVVARREAQIDERVGRLWRDTGHLGHQLTDIEDRVSASGETAVWAQRRADAAYARADDANARLQRLATTPHRRDLVETVHVHFAFDHAGLDDRAHTVLLEVARELEDNPASPW